MPVRMRSLLGLLAAALALSACGGGGGGSVAVPGGGGGQTIPPGSVAITPSTLAFTGPGDTPKTFTVTSTVAGVAAPSINSSACSPVATVTTSSTTLPATYTVTPTANGNCSFVADLGNASATIGVTVGPANGNPISGSTSNVALYAGGTSGSVSVNSTTGTFSYDASACNGIATVAPISSSQGSALYSVSPVAVGTCQFPIVNGSSSFIVNVTVNAPPSGPAALTVSPTTMTFTGAAAAPQSGTLNFTGSVGQVSINENDCIGNTGKAKIAYLTLNGTAPGAPISLPASFTVTLYGSGATGTCSIVFTPQNGTAATLTVTAQ